MQAVAFLSFLLPLVASLPSGLNGRSEASRPAVGHRRIMNLAQFNFSNWTMSEVSQDCSRATTDVMYDCTFTCKFIPLWPVFSLSSSSPSPLSHFPFYHWRNPPLLRNRVWGANNPSSGHGYDVVHWDDPNFNTSSYCKNHWQWDGVTTTPGPGNTYNTDYFVCEEDLPELWQFKFFQIDDAGGFSMSLSHRCIDDMYVFLPSPPPLLFY